VPSGPPRCPTVSSSPADDAGYSGYVFAGKVVEIIAHTWTVDVDRVWKGADKLAAHVHLLDVYSGIDCASYFDNGRSYLFFVVVAKSSRYTFYQPQVCNWTSALQSKRVADADASMWLEDFIVKNYGPGERPRGEDPWARLSRQERNAQE
jgi:hypothetical protein